MTVRSMTEERLLLLLSGSEIQLQSVEKALAKLEAQSKLRSAEQEEHAKLLGRYCLQLEGLIEHTKTASERLLRRTAYLAMAFAALTSTWLLIAYLGLLTNI